MLVDSPHHRFVLMGTRYGQHVRMHFADGLLVAANATGDDNPAIFRHSLADSIQRLLLGAIEKPTGIDYHHIGILVTGRDLVALQSQLGEDTLGIHQRLGTT